MAVFLIIYRMLGNRHLDLGLFSVFQLWIDYYTWTTQIWKKNKESTGNESCLTAHSQRRRPTIAHFVFDRDLRVLSTSCNDHLGEKKLYSNCHTNKVLTCDKLCVLRVICNNKQVKEYIVSALRVMSTLLLRRCQAPFNPLLWRG